MTYKPRMEDLEWARMIIRTLNDGGIVAYPDAGLFYRLDHGNKVMTLLNQSGLSDMDSALTHARTKVVFGMLGYTVNEAHEFSAGVGNVPNEVAIASGKLGAHIVDCDQCTRMSPFLCLEGYSLLRNFHMALYMATFDDSRRH